MISDPWGNRLTPGGSPRPGQGMVELLVEVCDPPGGVAHAYTVNGYLVSDFVTPSYHEPVAISAARYSFTGAITRPRDIVGGGYLAWREPTSREWWAKDWVNIPGPYSAGWGSSTIPRSRCDSRFTPSRSIPSSTPGLPLTIPRCSPLASAWRLHMPSRERTPRASTEKLSASSKRKDRGANRLRHLRLGRIPAAPPRWPAAAEGAEAGLRRAGATLTPIPVGSRRRRARKSHRHTIRVRRTSIRPATSKAQDTRTSLPWQSKQRWSVSERRCVDVTQLRSVPCSAVG